MKIPRAMQVFLTIWCAWTVVAASAAPAPCPRPCRCYVDDKGKQAANCTGVPAAAGGAAAAAWPQTVLRVRLDDGPVTLKDGAFARFPRLTYLDIGGGALGHVGARAFDGLPELVELNAIGAGVRRVHRDAFAGNPKLAFLSLGRNPGLAVGPSFVASRSLAELDVSECALTALKSAYFDALPGLKYLTAAGNRLTAVGRQFAPAGIKYADLSNNRIATVHDDLEAYKRLRTVVMTGNPVDCTCELAETGRRLTARGVSFADTVSCRNARNRSLDDMADACRSSADAMTMMADEPDGDDIYESDDLLKVDEETARRQREEQEQEEAYASGSGSGEDPLRYAAQDSSSTTEDWSSSSSSTTEDWSSSSSSTTEEDPSSSADPSSSTTSGGDDDYTSSSSSSAIPVEEELLSSSALPVEQYATESTSPFPSSSSSSPATGIVVSNPILLPKDDGRDEAGGGGDDGADDGGGGGVAAAMGYVRSNALVTGVAVVLAAIVVAIVYKAVCAGRGRGNVGGDGGGDDRKVVELKEIKYTAADRDDSSRPRDDDDDEDYDGTAAGSSAEENLLGDHDDTDDDDDDDEDNDAASTPPARAAGPLSNGDMVKIDLGPGTALEGAPAPAGVVPTRVVVKLGETPKACKPITIDNVH